MTAGTAGTASSAVIHGPTTWSQLGHSVIRYSDQYVTKLRQTLVHCSKLQVSSLPQEAQEESCSASVHCCEANLQSAASI